jgi:hypothetical protein
MQANEYPQRVERLVRIKRIDPMSLGKFSGVLLAVVGLIVGVLFALASLVGMAGVGGGRGGLFGLIFGVGAIVFVPIIYGIAGFLGGLIQGYVYNIAAGLMGGIDITVE